MLDALRHVLEAEPGVAYALLFGSGARGTAHPGSDADVAVELTAGTSRDVQALGGLAARLESAAARRVDLRDGRLVVERDHAALVARKARVLLEYLDFKPVEERCAAGVLRAAAARGR